MENKKSVLAIMGQGLNVRSRIYIYICIYNPPQYWEAKGSDPGALVNTMRNSEWNSNEHTS